MKNLIYCILLVGFVATIAACNKDDDDHDHEEGDYHVHIMSPDTTAKHVGDTIHIHVEFEEHDGGTIDHVNVEIANKEDGSVIYSAPAAAHVHEESGKYEHHDDIILDVDAHTNWIMTAKVWGHDDDTDQASSTVEFHVHP